MKLRLLVLACVLVSFTSCLDIIETFNLNENGGGTYQTKMDMSKMMGMMAMMGAGKNTSDKMPEKMDSSFAFKAYTDTATNLTAEEKMVLSKAVAAVHLDQAEGEMYFTINVPFNDPKEYAIINSVLSRTEGQPLENAFKGLFGGGGSGSNPFGGDDLSGKKDDKGGLPSSNFETFLSTSQLSRKVKPQPKTEATKTPIDDKDMPEDLKEMFKVNYTTVVNLPRPAKKVSGTEGKLSEDKKQVKFSKKIDLTDGFTAKDFDFTIDF